GIFPSLSINNAAAPTWRKNDVGAASFSRHGVKTMSGQRHSPDMAQKRCRGSSIPPTWRENDVGAGAFSRHGAKTMSGQRRITHKKTTKNHPISGGSNSILYLFFFHDCFRLLDSFARHFAPYPHAGQQYRDRNAEVAEDRVEEVYQVHESDQAQEVADDDAGYKCDFIASGVWCPESGQERIQHADCRVIDDQQHDNRKYKC